MWLFLLTEIMFFGGLFTAYLIMRNWYYPAVRRGFAPVEHLLGHGQHGGADCLQLHHGHGRVVALRCAARAALLLCLSLTLLFGFTFLGIKGIEWHEKWEKHHVPGIHDYSIAVLSRSRLGPGGA